MRKSALTAVLLLAVAIGFAAESKQVTYKSGDEAVSATLYTPANAKGKLPGIIVIHEWWGLDEWVKQQASRLADQGYATLAVDLYRGKVTKDPSEAHEIMRGLPPDRAVRDLKAAFEYLAKQPNVDPSRIGAIGWCMGGGYALALAENEPRLAATVINYGHVGTETDELKKINASVLGIFGGKDRGIPVDDVKRFEQQLKQLGKRVEVVIYPEAGHAFQNPNNKAHRPDDTADSWKRTLAFLEKNLQQKQ